MLFMKFLIIALIHFASLAHGFQENEVQFQTSGNFQLKGFLSRPTRLASFPFWFYKWATDKEPLIIKNEAIIRLQIWHAK